jgi:hypothetical protein
MGSVVGTVNAKIRKKKRSAEPPAERKPNLNTLWKPKDKNIFYFIFFIPDIIFIFVDQTNRNINF